MEVASVAGVDEVAAVEVAAEVVAVLPDGEVCAVAGVLGDCAASMRTVRVAVAVLPQVSVAT